jgi:hypothetical protein
MANNTVIYSIDPVRRLVQMRLVGDPTIVELSSTMTTIFADSHYRPGFAFLVDRREAVPPTVEYVNMAVKLAHSHAQKLADSRIAFVVQGAASFGMARITQTLLGDLPLSVAVFREGSHII